MHMPKKLFLSLTAAALLSTGCATMEKAKEVTHSAVVATSETLNDWSGNGNQNPNGAQGATGTPSILTALITNVAMGQKYGNLGDVAKMVVIKELATVIANDLERENAKRRANAVTTQLQKDETPAPKYIAISTRDEGVKPTPGQEDKIMIYDTEKGDFASDKVYTVGSAPDGLGAIENVDGYNALYVAKDPSDYETM